MNIDWEYSNELSCDGKRIFLTWKQAQTHNNKMSKPGSVLRAKGKKIEKMHVYQCKKCHLYHIGHDVRRRLRHRQPYSRRAFRQTSE